MYILVFNGSPHPKGNTAALVKEFVKGAKEAGHQVEVVDLSHKRIDGCLGCDYCVRQGREGNCLKKDEMRDIYPLLKKADALVIATPIYYFTWSAQTHAALQRCYAFGKPPALKKMALMCSSYSPDVYTGSIATYHDICNYWGVEDVGIVTAYGEQNKSEQKLAEAHALGAAF